MRHAFAPLTLAMMALLNGAPSWAGSPAGGIAVNITLNGSSGLPQPGPGLPLQGPDVCFSRSLSEQTRARVEVTCAAGRFVSIEAVSGAPFLGVHGGAFRYVVPLAAVSRLQDAGEAWTGGGTVTMLRIYDLTRPEGPGELWWDRPLEMRVSF